MSRALLLRVNFVKSFSFRPTPLFFPKHREFSTSLKNQNALLNQEYDVIVVGGGHAGCDAAAAAARTGAKTALVTQRLDTIGELSCNPSIGGIGKGHLVREIDALDGLIGTVADEAGIHFRVLNRSKGPAVRGPRAQMDRDLYKTSMQATLKSYPNLHLIEASVQDLLLDESGSPIESLAPMSMENTIRVSGTGLLGMKSQSDDRRPEMDKMMHSATSATRNARIRGVIVQTTESENQPATRHEIQARAVVITTGTFLRGVLMIGHDRYAGGRHLRDSELVEPPSVGLAHTLARFKFPLGRLKTGTPPRIDGSSIDWDACTIQPSEVPAQPFSHIRQFNEEQPPMVTAGTLIDCYQTATNEKTHELVMKYEHTLPIYDGLDGKGNGPRYCPSLYKKVQRFPDRTGHNCFLEPEGLNTNIVYPNGMSGPYPEEIQLKIIRSMKGLGAVDIVRPGYDVEYDFVNPQALTHTLETKSIGGLFLAGQICGTTGYEEAAAQGIIAGANAGRAAVAASSGENAPSPLIIGRDEGYIGVLIDDLVTRGTLEPYRMFTSRAEYRISLRADNADLRLTRKGIDFGLVRDEERISALDAREMLIGDRIEQLQKFDLKVTEWSARGGNDLMGGAQVSRKQGQKKTAEEILIMPHVTLNDVENIMMDVRKESAETSSDEISFMKCPLSVYDTVEASVKYKSYVRRQYKDMDSWRRAQGLRIPPDVVYDHNNLPTLSNEELEKLTRIRPSTFHEASQISGMTPQSLVYLYHHVMRRNRQRDRRSNEPVTISASS
ncbi:tRNA uridine 5-carboxymethylaminomethyl modification enzyme [Fistulifera solaris]|uniref:tRNA uridine 5-carboxymethylaminomethyl modification enzyme n=1 Tax=Fistulifera solaris TaxID=1519565 RepID=A0A1Z5JJD8_FISSO|nr:tRNA uridine 5-carboxymethylaminomethyl modification enzyme [Fistulifera solaris]|eukprot:GAX13881.1 tRNA uridine 5-carboxymethylaminomethyl modification enzyme [Fistulifera solaris]